MEASPVLDFFRTTRFPSTLQNGNTARRRFVAEIFNPATDAPRTDSVRTRNRAVDTAARRAYRSPSVNRATRRPQGVRPCEEEAMSSYSLQSVTAKDHTTGSLPPGLTRRPREAEAGPAAGERLDNQTMQRLRRSRARAEGGPA